MEAVPNNWTYLVCKVCPRTKFYIADLLIKRKVIILHVAEGVYGGPRCPFHGSTTKQDHFSFLEDCVLKAAGSNEKNRVR